jgi:hypothetical protein
LELDNKSVSQSAGGIEVGFECASVSRSEEVRFDHYKTVEDRHGRHEEQSLSTIHEQVRLPPVWLDVAADLVKRLRYLISIRLGYLSLSREIATLLLVKTVRHLWDAFCDRWTPIGVEKRAGFFSVRMALPRSVARHR